MLKNIMLQGYQATLEHMFLLYMVLNYGIVAHHLILRDSRSCDRAKNIQNHPGTWLASPGLMLIKRGWLAFDPGWLAVLWASWGGGDGKFSHCT